MQTSEQARTEQTRKQARKQATKKQDNRSESKKTVNIPWKKRNNMFLPWEDLRQHTKFTY